MDETKTSFPVIKHKILDRVFFFLQAWMLQVMEEWTGLEEVWLLLISRCLVEWSHINGQDCFWQEWVVGALAAWITWATWEALEEGTSVDGCQVSSEVSFCSRCYSGWSEVTFLFVFRHVQVWNGWNGPRLWSQRYANESRIWRFLWNGWVVSEMNLNNRIYSNVALYMKWKWRLMLV